MPPKSKPSRAIAETAAAGNLRLRGPSPTQRKAAGSSLVVPSNAGRFAVCLLDGRRRHFEICLEIESTYRCWSIIQGPSTDPRIRRLAVRGADRDPTAGAKQGVGLDARPLTDAPVAWDAGIWRAETDESVIRALERGQLTFTLEGSRMRGGWSLTRLKPDGRGESWVLVKERDTYATADDAMMAPLAPTAKGRGAPSGAEQGQARARPGLEPGAFVTPMSYTTASAVMDSPETIFEMDYGGYRVQLAKAGDHVVLRDRSGRDCGARFPTVVAAARALDLGRAMLDGEIVVLDERGRPDRSTLAEALASKRADGVTLIVFDILAVGEVDVRRRPLSARKTLLAKSLASRAPDGVIRVAPCVAGDGQALLREVAAVGGDGVIAKDARSVYRPGRSQAWRRIPITSETTLVVVGYMPSVRRHEVASLLVAERNGGSLVFRGRVADGLKGQTTAGELQSLPARRANVPAADVQGIGNGPKGARWINPGLRATIRYKSRSPAGHIVGGELVAILGDDTAD